MSHRVLPSVLSSQSIGADSVVKPAMVEPTNPNPEETWLSPFESLPDPRREQGTYHPLLTVLGIAILAVLCGANNCCKMIVTSVSE